MHTQFTARLLMFVGLLAGILHPAALGAEGGVAEDHASPYFLVEGAENIDGFPLLKTQVRASVAGMTTDVELIQFYKNNGTKTIEAVYVFPLGTRSAVHAMKMKIGTRVIEANIDETEKARATYTNAKNNGQTASLLEQKRPNVFQMNVANILPGDVIEVIVQYTETLVPEKGVYAFIFPTVVGPRFTGESSPADLGREGSWTAQPYLKEGARAPYDVDIAVSLKTGMPLARVWSPSHAINTHHEGPGAAFVLLAPQDARRGTRDFILNYTLKGSAIQTGLLLYPSEKENYFLMMMEPPQRVSEGDIAPREYLFIVDVSGSMHGFPLDTSKALMTRIITGLRGQDYFNIMFFSGGSSTLSATPLRATADNKQRALQMLSSFNGGGGTQLLNALRSAYTLEKQEGLSRIIVALTDGYVSVEKESFDLIREHLDEGNFFAFGIGTSVNRYLIEGMARAGKGEPFIVTDPEEGEEQAAKFFAYTQAPVLTDIQVSFAGFDAYDVEPPAVADLFAERPIVICGKYRHARGSITVTGRTARGDFKKTIAVAKEQEQKKNSALQYLWAREKIARLDYYAGLGVDTKEEVTQLGLAYHLMTKYTSFVAVDSLKRADGAPVTVNQPLPLPEGVSTYAVGGQNVACAGMVKQCFSAAPEARADRAVRKESNPIVPAPINKPAATRKLYVAGGTFPSGMTAYEFETMHLSAIAGGLEKIFARDGVTAVRLALDVRSGAVATVATLRHAGARYAESLIHALVKKLRLPPHFTGMIEVELKYY